MQHFQRSTRQLFSTALLFRCCLSRTRVHAPKKCAPHWLGKQAGQRPLVDRRDVQILKSGCLLASSRPECHRILPSGGLLQLGGQAREEHGRSCLRSGAVQLDELGVVREARAPLVCPRLFCRPLFDALRERQKRGVAVRDGGVPLAMAVAGPGRNLPPRPLRLASFRIRSVSGFQRSSRGGAATRRISRSSIAAGHEISSLVFHSPRHSQRALAALRGKNGYDGSGPAPRLASLSLFIM